MISLKLLLEEIEQERNGELDESKAAEDAKRQGLEYMSFGRYGKDGKVTHKSQGGKLVPIKGSVAPAQGKKSVAQQPAGQSKKAPPSKSNSAEMIRSKIVGTYDKNEYSDDNYAGVYDMEKLVTKRPPKTKQELKTLYDRISAYGNKNDMSDDWYSGVYDFMMAYEKTLK
jgi:hypothetical protein